MRGGTAFSYNLIDETEKKKRLKKLPEPCTEKTGRLVKGEVKRKG